jgi:hypothetical protein
MPGIFHGKIDSDFSSCAARGAGGCATSITQTHIKSKHGARGLIPDAVLYLPLRHDDVFVIQIPFDYNEISRSQRPSIISPRQMQIRRELGEII